MKKLLLIMLFVGGLLSCSPLKKVANNYSLEQIKSSDYLIILENQQIFLVYKDGKQIELLLLEEIPYWIKEDNK